MLGVLALSLAVACSSGSGEGASEVRAAGEAASPKAPPKTYAVHWDGRTLRHGLLGLSISVPTGWEIVSALERESVELSLDKAFQDSMNLSDEDMGRLESLGQECSKVYFTAFGGRDRSAGVTCMVLDQSPFPPEDRLGEIEFLQAQVDTARQMGQPIAYGPIETTALAGLPCHGLRSQQWAPGGVMVSEEYCLVRGDKLLHLGVLWKDAQSASLAQGFLQSIRALEAGDSR